MDDIKLMASSRTGRDGVLRNKKKDYGVVILLDALGTRNRIQNDICGFLADWN